MQRHKLTGCRRLSGGPSPATPFGVNRQPGKSIQPSVPRFINSLTSVTVFLPQSTQAGAWEPEVNYPLLQVEVQV